MKQKTENVPKKDKTVDENEVKIDLSTRPLLTPYKTSADRERYAFYVAVLLLVVFTILFAIGFWRMSSSQELNEWCKTIGQTFSPALVLMAGYYWPRR